MRYIIFIIISICFFQAAFVVDNDYISNIWDNEYDTYVLAEDDSYAIQKLEEHNELDLLPTFKNKFDFTQLPFHSLKIVQFTITEHLQSYKIYLRQLKLLI